MDIIRSVNGDGGTFEQSFNSTSRDLVAGKANGRIETDLVPHLLPSLPFTSHASLVVDVLDDINVSLA